MRSNRRRVLVAVGAVLAAGCTSGNDDPDGSETPTATPTPGDTPRRCDPADVMRPPVTDGENIDGRPYPTKPDQLTEGAILVYLDDFETAFAWNRILRAAPGTTSLTVENLDGFDPDETGDGFLASSGIRIEYTAEDETVQREYVANYSVARGPVYRRESESDPATPGDGEATVLVQCGPGD